jgi:hypothetical protein
MPGKNLHARRVASILSALALLLCVSHPAFGLGTPLSSRAIASTRTLLRVSVKVLLTPDLVPPRTGNNAIDRGDLLKRIVRSVEAGNRSLLESGSSLRLDLVEIVELPGLSFWNDTTRNCSEIIRDLERKAEFDETEYAFRKDAINLYVVGCGGNANLFGMGPDDDIIVLVPDFFIGAVPHEIGHYFGLLHTHNGGQDALVPEQCDDLRARGEDFVQELRPGDDGFQDTLPDHLCWTEEQLAVAAFGSSTGLTTDQEQAVSDTFENLMSYHRRRRLTEEQLRSVREATRRERSGVVAEEMQRIVDVDPDLPLAQRQEQLAQEFQGPWVAVEGDVAWLRRLDLTLVGSDWLRGGVWADVDSDETENWSGNRLVLVADSYGDALVGRPVTADPNRLLPNPYYTLTYTARLRYDDRLEVRIARFVRGVETAYNVEERKVILERPRTYEPPSLDPAQLVPVKMTGSFGGM